MQKLKIKNSLHLNLVIGRGQIFNGSGYVSANGYTSGDEVVVTGNDFYYRADYVRYLTYHETTTNVSLVLDPNAPTGTNPYVADVTVKDNNGNMAMGNMDVTVEDLSNNRTIAFGTAHNGTAQITLSDYYPSVSAIVLDSAFYTGSSGSATVQYNLPDMIQNENAKLRIIKDYIEKSGAFDYNAATGMYSMNSKDSANLWSVQGVEVGYEVLVSPSISQQVIDSGNYSDLSFMVMEYYNENGQDSTYVYNNGQPFITGTQFFDFWLGMKLAPVRESYNPPSMDYFTGLNGLDQLAENYSTLLHEPQTWVPDEEFISLVDAGLNQTVHTGFPAPIAGETLWGILNTLTNTLIQGFMTIATNAYNWMVTTALSLPTVQWMLGFWDHTVKPALGPVIEMVKSVVNVVLNQIVNTIVQPMLNGQTTSLNDLFGGVSPDTIASYEPSAFSNIETDLNSQSSQLSSVGSTMQSMMSSLSVFSGAGTILGPLISMAGPGIMVTLMSMIASVVMNSVLTPLFSEFNSTVLQNDLDTLMAPLGGTQNGSLTMLNDVAAMTAVTSQLDVASQDSGSGYVAQSTGSSVGATVTSNPINSVGTSSSSSSCDITAIGTCMAGLFNAELLLSQTALDNSNGAFSVFNTVAGSLFTSMDALQTGSSTPTAPTSPTDYAHMLGVLALAKDVLGIIKTYTSNSEDLLTIQLIRTYFDAVQLCMSILYRNEYPASMPSELWLVKTVISSATHVLGLINDWNNIVPLPGLSSFSNTLGLSTFDEASQELKLVVQFYGAVIFILYYLGQSSIPQNTGIFMGFYVLQKFAKMILFGLKFTGSKDKKIINLEIGLYVVSIGLNAFQMVFG